MKTPKTEKEIDSDITSLIWNHGLNLKRTDTDKHGYDMLVQYILKIALEKENNKDECKL